MRFVLFFIMGLDSIPAQSQTIVDACKLVTMFEFGMPEVYASDIQAFPELDPPRVRMRVSGEGPSNGVVSDALASALADALGQPQRPDNARRDYGVVRCEFESSEPPFRLTAFECAGVQCFISPSRLEELRLLLHREVATVGEPVNSSPQMQQGRATPLSEDVQRCWNVGALSAEAVLVSVTVGLDLSRDGVPSNMRLISHTGGSAAAADQAYGTARRAILRCAPYSVEDTGGGGNIELTFGLPQGVQQ